MAAKNSKGLYAGALALFLLGVGYLMFSGISENSMYFLNVSDALAMPSNELQSARLFGTVKGEGITKFQDEPGVVFHLEDKENTSQTLLVVYKGPVPDAFQAGAEVIVEGSLAPDNTKFTAETLMTKCPSKYKKENRG